MSHRSLTERDTVRAAMEMMRQFVEAQLRAASEIVRHLGEVAVSPEGRALLAAAERGETEPEPCYCWCAVAHQDRQGICEGEAVGTVVRESRTVGRVEIPVCGMCRTA